MTNKSTPNLVDKQQRTRPTIAASCVVLAVVAGLVSPCRLTLGPSLTTAATSQHWTASTFALPAGAASNPETDLQDVVCAGPSVCVAVGGYMARDGSGALIAWDNRGRWSAYEPSLPVGARTPTGATLSHVACASPTRCAAVGSYVTAAGQSEAFLTSGSGSSWASVPVRAPSGAGTKLVPTAISAIACAPGGPCVAAGSYGSPSRAMLVTGYGRSWAATSLPVPAGGSDVDLEAVACPSVARCIVLGGYGTPQGDSDLLSVVGHDGSWAATTLAHPSVPGLARTAKLAVGFTALQCPSASSCAAAAYYETTNTARHLAGAFVFTMEATSWRAQLAPLPAGASAAGYPSVNIPALACAPTCVAVVSYMGNQDGLNDVALSYLLQERADGSWAAHNLPPLPVAAHAEGPLELGTVSCNPAGTCLAAGTFDGGAPGTGSALVMGSVRRPAEQWQDLVAPSLPLNGAQRTEVDLTVVTCAATSCLAVGSYVTGPGNAQEPLVDALS